MSRIGQNLPFPKVPPSPCSRWAQRKTSAAILTVADGVESLSAQPVGGQRKGRLEQNEGDGQGDQLLAGAERWSLLFLQGFCPHLLSSPSRSFL